MSQGGAEGLPWLAFCVDGQKERREMTPEDARRAAENYLGSLHHNLEGSVEEPGIGKTLNAIGWLAIAISVVVSLFAVSGYLNSKAKFDGSWSIVIG